MPTIAKELLENKIILLCRILLVIFGGCKTEKKFVGGEILGETWEDTVRNWNGAVFRLYQTKFGAESCFGYRNSIRNM